MKKRLVAVVLAGALTACLALFGCADGEEKSCQGAFLGADGVDLASPNFSYSFPGYDVATGGYYQIPAVGASKKVAIPYVIDTGALSVSVNMGGSFRIVSVR